MNTEVCGTDMRNRHEQWPDGLPWVWGATPEEVARPHECDAHMADRDDRLVRAISVNASPDVVFAWLGNLRLAPYSYDWIDNFGRRSPRQLRADLGPFEPGQRVMYIFTVDSVGPDKAVTIRMRRGPGWRLFGDVWVTYAVTPGADEQSRLVAVLRFRSTGSKADAARRWLLAWGDLLMMRKQLVSLRDLAHEPVR
jgi:hypothetical protein